MLEQLEARTMLAGDFTNAVISDAEMATLLDGLDGFAEFERELSQTDEFAKPLALVTNPDGSPLSIGGLLDIGDVLEQKLAGPVRTFLGGLTPGLAIGERNTDGLVDFLENLPEVMSVMGGQTTMPTDELRFEVTFHDEVQLGDLGLDFGSQGDALGFDTGVDFTHPDLYLLHASIDMTVSFGVDLESEFNSEQAFFLRGPRRMRSR